VVEKTANRTIFVVRCKHVDNTNNRAIQPFSVPTGRDLPGNKTDTTTICAITINGVARQLVGRSHPHAQAHANPTILPIENQRVAASKRMQLAAATIVAGQETNKNDAIHVAEVCCVFFALEKHVSFSGF
jgi:hypothetical protein